MPIVNQIIMLFLIAAVGYFLRRTGVFTDAVIKGITKLVVSVTWPVMMIMITQRPYDDAVLNGFLTVLLASVLILFCTVVAYYNIIRKIADRRMRALLTMLATMPNAGYIGMPIIDAAYGPEGTLYLAAYIAGFNIVLWTLGVSLYTGFSLRSLKALINPGFLCAIVGTLFFVLRVQLPTPILSAVNQIGNMNTPLAMLLLGARMEAFDPRKLLDRQMTGAILAKLLVIPLGALFLLRLMGVHGIVLGVIVLATAMPSASAGQMLAEEHDAPVDYAARGISLCTLLCILSVPVVLLCMG